MFPLPRSSHPSMSSSSAVPEVLSVPLSNEAQSTDKAVEIGEHDTCKYHPELHSVSSYNSLSSLSSCGSDQSEEQTSVCGSEESITSKPRSIFKTYWEKSGSRPLSSVVTTDKSQRSTSTRATASVSSWDTDDESEAANSYERVLKRNEGIKSAKRRSIFGSQYQSTPSLARPYHPTPLEQRAKSAPDMQKRRLPSCLRSSARNARCSSVSFDCEVSVVTYSRPEENWAADGWSNYFH